MAHPLQKEVAAVRRRARSVLWLHGVAGVVAAVVAVVIALGAVDYLIRYQDPGLRIIASALTLGTLVWAVYHWLWQPLRRRWRDVEVAQRIERRFPQFKERLSSAIEFLRQGEHDPVAGSAALRRAVIGEATAQLEQVDLKTVVNRRPAIRAMLIAGGVCLLGLILVVLDPSSARLAVARLVSPLSATQWPRQNQLEFKNPLRRLALGQPFEVELIDRNQRLPDEVRIHYRFADGNDQWTYETDKMKFSDGVMLARRDGVVRPFEYRAEGGDDRAMEWIALEVIEPPLVESLQITLHPPAYTGWGPTTSPKRIRALRGTQIAMTGAATKPLSAASLQLDGGKPVAARVAKDGFAFKIDAANLVVEQSGAYWLQLTDSEGLVGGMEERWDIRAVTDTPPSVSIEQPAINLFVTAEATVPLKLLVKDDLAIHEISLVYSRSDRSDEGETTVPLYAGPAQVAPNPEGSLTGGELGESRVVEHAWNLAELQLAPGALLTVLARATDYLPQMGQSAVPRRITIITAAQLEDRLAERQAFILGELARVLKMQQETRGQTSSLQIQLQEVGQLNKRDIDDLQAAELNQRQVARTLTSPTDGIPLHIASLLSDLANNRVDSPEIERRMRQFQSEIDRLDKEPLPTVARELTGALKTAQAALDQSPDAAQTAAVGQPLATAGAAQDEVIVTLEKLLGDLSQWADYRRFARDVRQIRQQQEQLEQATQQVGQQTLTKDLKELTAQQRAELQKLASRQLELARRFDKTMQGMEEMSGQLSEQDPLAAGTLEDALHEARQQAIGGQMRQSGREVGENRLGQAVRRQAQTNQQLDSLLDILANRREHELSRLVQKLREAEQELSELRQRQKGLQKKIADAEKEPNAEERQKKLERLRREQKQLEEEVARMARQLKRLQAGRAGRSAEQGAAKLSQSRASGEAGDAGEAAEQAAGAQKDLDEAQEQLAEARKKAEEDLAREQLARFEDTLKSLIDQQRLTLTETERLEELKQAAGELSPAQSQSLHDLARQQQRLGEETGGHAETMKASPVFELALRSAAQRMNEAVELLLQQQTADATQRRQRGAIARLEQLLQALADDPQEKNDQDKEEGQGGGQGGGKQGGGNVRDLAELKLLKLMQQGLRQRTEELHQAAAGQPQWTADQQQEIAQLVTEQGRLADLVFDLLEPETTSEEDDPEKLPELE